MAQKEDVSIIVRDGTKLSGYEILIDNPIAIICLVHGLGEHVGRYEHVADFFTQNGLSFYAFDQRGHGSSEGKRGHTPSHERMLDDLEEILMYARAEYNDIPIFLFGHSMGGNIVLNYILKKNIGELKGAIASTPWLKTKITPPKWQVAMANILVKIFPSLTQPNGLKIDWLTNKDDVNQAYAQDPAVHNKISIRLFLDFFHAGLWALKNAPLLKIPTFVYHGCDDPIALKEASEDFAQDSEKFSSFKLYPETKHEPHNDVKQKEVLDDVLTWVKKSL
ncbi:MAG: lysophospholipase [Reichenbachiella sp.]